MLESLGPLMWPLAFVFRSIRHFTGEHLECGFLPSYLLTSSQQHSALYFAKLSFHGALLLFVQRII